jgi:hypothetical protein
LIGDRRCKGAPQQVECHTPIPQLTARHAEEWCRSTGLEMNADRAERSRRFEIDKCGARAGETASSAADRVYSEDQVGRGRGKHSLARVRLAVAAVDPEAINERGQRRRGDQSPNDRPIHAYQVYGNDPTLTAALPIYTILAEAYRVALLWRL